MKILQVCSRFYHHVASGSTKVAYCISEELVKRGHSITVYTSDMKDKYRKIGSGTEKVNGIRVIRFPSIGTLFTREMKFFVTPTLIAKIIKDIRVFDVVHIHEHRSFQSLITAFFSKKYKIPYVVHLHGSLSQGGAWSKLKRLYDILVGYRLLMNASKVIALSTIEAQQCKTVGIPEEKITIVPNGIDICRTELPSRGKFRKKYGIEKDSQIILYLGRINRYKGLDFLIDGYKYLIKEMNYDKTVLVIAGVDEGYLQNLIDRVCQFKISGKVLFVGPLFGIEKLEAYVDASIFVSLDSLKQVVFLLTPLEAAACGTPIIVTESNYIAQLAEQEGFGFSVKYGDVVKLASVLKKMLSDERLREEMGMRGKNFVRANFEWNDIIQRIERIYEELARKRN